MNNTATKKQAPKSAKETKETKDDKTKMDMVKNAGKNGEGNPEDAKAKTTEQKQEQPRPLTLDETMDKIEQLKALVDKRQRLSEAKKKLDMFSVNSDKFSDVLVISNSNGQEFRTSNTAVIAEVLGLLKGSIAGKIREVESQIVV